jgi:hypothetical protein
MAKHVVAPVVTELTLSAVTELSAATTEVLTTPRDNFARGFTRRTDARFVFVSSFVINFFVADDVVVVIIIFLFLLLFRFKLLLVLLLLLLVTSDLFVTFCPTFCGLVGVRNTT